MDSLPEHIEGLPLAYAIFDPGEMNGWAVFDVSGTLRFFGQVSLKDLISLLNSLPDSIQHIVYEDYIIRPGVNHSGSRGPAIVSIGKIQAFAEIREIPLKKQSPSIKSIGYTRLKMKAPGNHAKSHKFDAVAHGEYWIWKNHIRKKWEKENGSDPSGRQERSAT